MKSNQLLTTISISLALCLSGYSSLVMACEYHPNAGADHDSELTSWMTNNEPTSSANTSSSQSNTSNSSETSMLDSMQKWLTDVVK